MSENRQKIPAAFGYALFAGTSTMMAFLLPVVFWAIFINDSTLPGWFQITLIDIFMASCLYHGYYRAKTLATDLGAEGAKLSRWQKLFRITLYFGLFALLIVNISILLTAIRAAR